MYVILKLIGGGGTNRARKRALVTTDEYRRLKKLTKSREMSLTRSQIGTKYVRARGQGAMDQRINASLVWVTIKEWNRFASRLHPNA